LVLFFQLHNKKRKEKDKRGKEITKEGRKLPGEEEKALATHKRNQPFVSVFCAFAIVHTIAAQSTRLSHHRHQQQQQQKKKKNNPSLYRSAVPVSSGFLF
jgi:hypothetical protein